MFKPGSLFQTTKPSEGRPWITRAHCLFVVLIGSVTLMMAGCGKKTAPQAASSVAPNPAAPGQAAEASADMGSVLAQLTQTLRKYSFEHRHVPATFSELVAADHLAPVPVAPAGKEFAVDVKSVQVILVKR